MSSAYRKPDTCRQHHAALTGGVTYSKPARTTSRRIRIRRIRVAGLLVVIAAIAAALGYQLLASSSSTAASPIDVLRSASPSRNSSRHIPPGLRRRAPWRAWRGRRCRPRRHDGLRRRDSGCSQPRSSISSVPCARLQRTPRTTGSSSSSIVAGAPRSTRNSYSTWRSRSTARRRKLPDGWPPPTTSAHVSGDAVDIGPVDATAWLSEHGAEYGLCQIYGNEPWHYELRPEAIDHGCPPMYADPTHDPRMQ